MGFNLKLISKEEREYFNKLFCYLGFTYFCYQKVCSHVVAILDFFFMPSSVNTPSQVFPSPWIYLLIILLFLNLSTMLEFVYTELVHHTGFISPCQFFRLLGVSFSLTS